MNKRNGQDRFGGPSLLEENTNQGMKEYISRMLGVDGNEDGMVDPVDLQEREEMDIHMIHYLLGGQRKGGEAGGGSI